MEHKGISFGRTMMQTLELLGWQRCMSPDEATLIREAIKPVAIAIIELCFALVSSSKSVSQSFGAEKCVE